MMKQELKKMGFFKRIYTKIKKILIKLCSTLFPFELTIKFSSYKDAFYYPQRFITPLVISTVSIIYLTIIIYGVIGSVRDTLDNLKITVRKGIYSFLKTSVGNALLYYKYDITDKDMSSVYEIVSQVEGFFDQLVLAIYIGFIISTSLAAGLYLLGTIFVLLDFRKKSLMLRRGHWPYHGFSREAFNVSQSVDFIGAFISNSVLGFISVLVLYGIIFTPLCYSVFWIIIFLNIKTILIFLIPSVGKSIGFMIFKKIFSTGNFVTWRM